MNFRKSYISHVFLTGVFAGCFFFAGFASCSGLGTLSTEALQIRTASGSIVTVSTEIARSEAEQEKGYMGRKTIADGTGMIFTYTADRQMNFWMKNTPHPLSIAFIDASGIIREIYDMVPYSLDTVSSIRSLRYALEVPAGWFDRAHIAIGDQLTAESLFLLTHK